MTKEKLYEILKNNKINESRYSLEGGSPKSGYVLSSNNNGWEVCYRQFGIDYKTKFYKNESDACIDIYNRIMGFVSSYDGDRKHDTSWRFIGAWSHCFSDLFGVNVFDYEWHDTGEKIVLEDPHYEQKRSLKIYEITIDGEVKKFATCEFSNSVYGFYVE